MSAEKMADTAPLLNSLSAIAQSYEHYILDIFGVLHDGIEPFAQTIETLRALKRNDAQICLLSNTPRRAEITIGQLAEMGITRDLYDHIVTSGETTFHALNNPEDYGMAVSGSRCWYIHEREESDQLLESLPHLERVYTPQQADFILNALPGTSDEQMAKLREDLREAAQQNLPMICANPDLIVNIGDTVRMCAGTYAKFYEEDLKSGPVFYIGKPHLPVYERCHQLLGKPDKSSIVAIGDALHTDVAGANAFGIDSVFNLSGIHRTEVLHETSLVPCPHKISALIDSQKHRPSYVLDGFIY